MSEPFDFDALAAEVAAAFAQGDEADHPAHVVTEARLSAVGLIEGFALRDEEQRRARSVALMIPVFRQGVGPIAELVNTLAGFAHSAMTVAASLAENQEEPLPVVEQIDELRRVVLAMAQIDEDFPPETEGDGRGAA